LKKYEKLRPAVYDFTVHFSKLIHSLKIFNSAVPLFVEDEKCSEGNDFTLYLVRELLKEVCDIPCYSHNFITLLASVYEYKQFNLYILESLACVCNLHVIRFLTQQILVPSVHLPLSWFCSKTSMSVALFCQHFTIPASRSPEH